MRRLTPLSGKTDLIILGGGSAAFSAALKANELGATSVIINDGLPIGGTCVNTGCVPSKTLLRAADTLHRAANNPFKGIEVSGKLADFSEVIAQKRELVESVRQAKYLDVIKDSPNIKIVQGHGTLIDMKTVSVNGVNYQTDKIIIATGSSAYIPPIKGLAESGCLTSENLFELEELPRHGGIIVLGGRYIALECAQMLSRFGSRVTVLQRSGNILPDEEKAVTGPLAALLKAEGISIHTGVNIEEVRRDGQSVSVTATVNGKPEIFKASHLLCATGQKPNSTGIGLEESGVEVTGDGRLRVSDDLQTGVPGIYGAGDVIGEPMFVYTAAYEGALAAENALTGSSKKRDYNALPWVLFTDPQLAGVGMDERQAAKAGFDAQTSTLPMELVPRALAARDTRGFVKLVRDVKTDKLLGARVVAAEGAEMIMEATLAIKYGITASELADTFHPYLTLSEAIKLAAIGFKKDVKKLSCCAG